MQHFCEGDWTHGWWEEEEEARQGASPRGAIYLLLHCAYHIKREFNNKQFSMGRVHW